MRYRLLFRLLAALMLSVLAVTAAFAQTNQPNLPSPTEEAPEGDAPTGDFAIEDVDGFGIPVPEDFLLAESSVNDTGLFAAITSVDYSYALFITRYVGPTGDADALTEGLLAETPDLGDVQVGEENGAPLITSFFPTAETESGELHIAQQTAEREGWVLSIIASAPSEDALEDALTLAAQLRAAIELPPAEDFATPEPDAAQDDDATPEPDDEGAGNPQLELAVVPGFELADSGREGDLRFVELSSDTIDLRFEIVALDEAARDDDDAARAAVNARLAEAGDAAEVGEIEEDEIDGNPVGLLRYQGVRANGTAIYIFHIAMARDGWLLFVQGTTEDDGDLELMVDAATTLITDTGLPDVSAAE